MLYRPTLMPGLPAGGLGWAWADVRGGPDQSRRRQGRRADELPAIDALPAHDLSPPADKISFRAEISFSFCSLVPTLIRSLSSIPGAFQYRTKIFRCVSCSWIRAAEPLPHLGKDEIRVTVGNGEPEGAATAWSEAVLSLLIFSTFWRKYA